MEMEILRELIEDIFDESEIGEQTDFYEDLDADWLDMVELMYACEEEFDTEIGEDAMRRRISEKLNRGHIDLFASYKNTRSDATRGQV